MADKARYPQIPSTVWWGVRSILQRTPNVTIDERFLGVNLSVQETAAKMYVSELRGVGILSDEGKPTPLAHKWRLDESYADAVTELMSTVYPDGLLHVAPPGDAERQKVVSWFMREGLGQGAAGNKAATYLLLSSPIPNESAKITSKSNTGEKSQRLRKSPSHSSTQTTDKEIKEQDKYSAKTSTSDHNRSKENFPLNINVQIHISADAGSEQIESIFKSMKRYLYNDENN